MTRSNRTSSPTRQTDVNEPRGRASIDGAARTPEQAEGVVAPEHGGGQVDDVAVDEAGGVEGVGDGGPALDEHLQHATPAELVEHGPEVARQLEARVDLGAGRRLPEHDPQGIAPARRDAR